MSQYTLTIPPKNRPEWRLLVTGRIQVEFKNYVLQMKVEQAKQNIKNGNITAEKAIEELHSLCEKFALAVQIDCKNIFKQW